MVSGTFLYIFIFHPNPINATRPGHVSSPTDNAVTWRGSVSVALSDSQFSRRDQLRFPAGGTDSGRSKTEQKTSARRRRNTAEPRGGGDHSCCCGFSCRTRNIVKGGWGVLGLEGERISCFVLISSVPFTALTPCVSAPSIGKEQPRSRCSASADAPFSTSGWSFGRGRQQRIETAARHRGSEVDEGAEEGSRQEGSQKPQVPRSPRG